MPKSNLYQNLVTLLKGNERFPHQSSGKFRPSEGTVVVNTPHGPLVKGACARQIYYRLSHQPVTDDTYSPHQIKRMKVGSLVEDELAEELMQAGLLLGRNIKFTATMKGVPISGEMDIVAKTSIDSKTRFCCECKSIYSYYPQKQTFGRFLNLGKEPGVPKDSYVMQLGMYLYKFSLLPKSDPSYIPFGAIYVCDRGDGHFGVFDTWLERQEIAMGEDEVQIVHRPTYASEHMRVPTKQLPYTMEDIFARQRGIIQALEAKQLPPRDFNEKWDAETTERRYAQGEVTDKQYDKWKKSHTGRGRGAVTLGDWNCSPLYCKWYTQCKKDG